jgi:hypothetical protein
MKVSNNLGSLLSTEEAPLQVRVNSFGNSMTLVNLIKKEFSKKTRCPWTLKTLLSTKEALIKVRMSWFRISLTMVN